MRKVFKNCFLTAEDIGVEKYTVNEIASKMKPVEIIHDESSLYGFAHSITTFLDRDISKSNNDPNKTLNTDSLKLAG